ncbi:MAG: GAF domain-containing protein [Terriglobales bacterium]
MDTHSILDGNSSQAAPRTASAGIVLPNLASTSGAAAAPAMAREKLRFPGEDGGKSLSEMAQRDLDATLQLLAERAQYITGASGSAVALRQDQAMVCCASVGKSAPGIGTHLQIASGLSGESVRTRQTLHCDDAENDPRVNRESCRALGIASVVVMPLLRGEEVYGVFELLADRPNAFEERDFVALQRLAEMIQTAVEHAEAARRAESELGGKPQVAVPAAPQAIRPPAEPAPGNGTAEAAPKTAIPLAHSPARKQEEIGAEPLDEASDFVLTGPIELGKVGTCEACGFPVSQGRRFCLDCEAVSPSPEVEDASDLLAEVSADSQTGWVRSHVYLIAAGVLVVATIAVLFWRL